MLQDGGNLLLARYLVAHYQRLSNHPMFLNIDGYIEEDSDEDYTYGEVSEPVFYLMRTHLFTYSSPTPR